MHSGTFLVQCQQIRSTGTRRRSEQRPGDQVWVTDSRLCPAVWRSDLCGFRVRVSHLDLLFVALTSDLMWVQCLAGRVVASSVKRLFRTSLARSLLNPMFQKVGVYLRYNIYFSYVSAYQSPIVVRYDTASFYRQIKVQNIR